MVIILYTVSKSFCEVKDHVKYGREAYLDIMSALRLKDLEFATEMRKSDHDALIAIRRVEKSGYKGK